MKKLLSLTVGLALAIFMLTSCSSASSQTGSGVSSPKKDEIKVDQIDWKVENAVIDKNRRVVFSYTNKSKANIVNLELDFVLLPNVTPEMLRAACESFKEEGWTDKELESISTATDSQMASLTATGEWGQLVAPGETSGEDPMLFNYFYMNNIEQYNLCEPNMMMIQYVSTDEKLYEEIYDFKTKSYSLSGTIIDTKQWSDSELANQLPRPENLFVLEIEDTTTRFKFETIGSTPSEFKDYIAACKEKGFTAETRERSSAFDAKSSDGKYSLSLSYDEDEGCISTRISTI